MVYCLMLTPRGLYDDLITLADTVHAIWTAETTS